MKPSCDKNANTVAERKKKKKARAGARERAGGADRDVGGAGVTRALQSLQAARPPRTLPARGRPGWEAIFYKLKKSPWKLA